MRNIAPLATLICLLALAGCSTRVEEPPVEIVESAAVGSIEAGDGDPGKWLIEGSCVAQGPCHVDVYDPYTGDLAARNRYVVKDSRATINGSDNIRTIAGTDGGS